MPKIKNNNFTGQTRLDKYSTIRIILISIVINIILKIKHKLWLSPESVNVMQIKLIGSNHTRRAQFFFQFLHP